MHARRYLEAALFVLASYALSRTSLGASTTKLSHFLSRTRSMATTTTTKATTRVPVKSVYAHEQDEGVGARVRRSIGGMQLRHITPFLMLDHFSSTPGAGFPSHPHRGQGEPAARFLRMPSRPCVQADVLLLTATLTRIVKGAMDHADSTGREGRLFAGDVQFMEAGRGVAHSEMPVTEDGVDNCEGMQLWLDLPTEQYVRSADGALPSFSR